MKRYSLIVVLMVLMATACASFAAPTMAAKDNFGFGILTTVHPFALGGTPVLTYKFNNAFKGHAGINFGSYDGHSVTDFIVKGDITVMKAAGSNLYVPICIEYVSVADVDQLTGMIFSGGIGAETYIRPNFSIGFDAYLFSVFSPTDGDQTSSILGSGRMIATYYF